jgi:hypothetical protein
MKQDKKVKTINVSEKLHTELKDFCNQNSYKINLFVEKIISNAIRSSNESKPE